MKITGQRSEHIEKIVTDCARGSLYLFQRKSIPNLLQKACNLETFDVKLSSINRMIEKKNGTELHYNYGDNKRLKKEKKKNMAKV